MRFVPEPSQIHLSVYGSITIWEVVYLLRTTSSLLLHQKEITWFILMLAEANSSISFRTRPASGWPQWYTTEEKPERKWHRLPRSLLLLLASDQWHSTGLAPMPPTVSIKGADCYLIFTWRSLEKPRSLRTLETSRTFYGCSKHLLSQNLVTKNQEKTPRAMTVKTEFTPNAQKQFMQSIWCVEFLLTMSLNVIGNISCWSGRLEKDRLLCLALGLKRLPRLDTDTHQLDCKDRLKM